MATFEASLVRAVAIELKERANSLQDSIQPIVTAIDDWVLNGTDPMLPDPYAVKLQLDAYKTIVLRVLRLEEWGKQIQQAQEEDTLTYPPPPISLATGKFDGSALFDGSTTFNGGDT